MKRVLWGWSAIYRGITRGPSAALGMTEFNRPRLRALGSVAATSEWLCVLRSSLFVFLKEALWT